MKKIIKLSIVIPVFNEVNNIDIILKKLNELEFDHTEKEIIIVDDGSNDGTKEKLRDYRDKYKIIFKNKNEGKGSAVREGYKASTGDYIIIQDADLEYDPQDIKLLIDKAEKTNALVVFGSRALGMGKRETPGIFYYFGGHLLTVITNFLFGTNITDEPTCYKMFRSDIIKDIKLECSGFEFCPEITAKAVKAGHKIEEVPISYKTRTKADGKKIKLFKDGFLAIWTLFKYRFNDWNSIKGFIRLYKWWLILLVCFLLIRVILFSTLWAASADGWESFYGEAQSARNVLLQNWHEPCDWHPPLYYFFTTILLLIFKTPWAIYIIQIIAAFFSVIMAEKIARRFFSARVAFVAAFLMAIEPFSAWHNFLLTAENIYTLLILVGVYLTIKYIQENKTLHLACAGFIFGLATLTRLNSLVLTLALTILILFVYFLRSPLSLQYFTNLKFKNILVALVIFNLTYLAVLFPWQARNKIVYGKFTIANVLFTNFFICNYPTAMSIRDNIGYEEAQEIIIKKTEKELGQNVGDQGDCSLYSKEELIKQFDYYKKESNNYIKENFWQYSKLHLIRATPFFLQSGYLNLIKAYTGEYNKPDLTASLMKGDMKTVFDYLKNINFSLFAYLFGLIFWGLGTLSAFGGVIYSYFKDRKKFVFFLLSSGIIIYTALLCSPFILARYRLPVYIFFLVPLVYMIGELFIYVKKSKVK
ncbi:glycosyltransferase [Candidatus Parcubacteria bacterium]|nr:glycosyltransferase [Candidatus Parcubacteria bacterium]